MLISSSIFDVIIIFCHMLTGIKPLRAELVWENAGKYSYIFSISQRAWWLHQMEIFSALLALCVGNSPVTGEFPSQRPVTRSFDVFFDLNKLLSKQSWGLWFETPSRSLWRHCNVSMSFDAGCRWENAYDQGCACACACACACVCVCCIPKAGAEYM